MILPNLFHHLYLAVNIKRICVLKNQLYKLPIPGTTVRIDHVYRFGSSVKTVDGKGPLICTCSGFVTWCSRFSVAVSIYWKRQCIWQYHLLSKVGTISQTSKTVGQGSSSSALSDPQRLFGFKSSKAVFATKREEKRNVLQDVKRSQEAG